MQEKGYIYFIILCLLIGFILMQYDLYLMNKDFESKIGIEYEKSLQVKKKFVRLYRDGRTEFINDSIIYGPPLRGIDSTIWLDQLWGQVDSLIKDEKSDTLKAVLNNGKILYFEVRNPLLDNMWQ